MIDSQIVLIGTSAGGVTAIHDLLLNLSPDFKLPIVVIQHLPESNHVEVAQVYPSHSLKVVEIEDKMPVEAGFVYFAPGGYHLQFERDQTFSLSQDEPVRFSRPSIDLCFESAAKTFGKRVIGVVLTGANSDGALGLVQIKQAGGKTIVQNPETAEFAEMPDAALKALSPDYVTPLEALPKILFELQSEAAK